MLERRPLESKTVISAGYDERTHRLELEFAGGRVYRYREVPPGVFDWLLRTPSKGAYVARMIADRYPYEALPDGDGDAQVQPGSLEDALRASLQPQPDH